MKKFYKARAWLVRKLGGVMFLDTLAESPFVIRESPLNVEKLRAFVYQEPFFAARTGSGIPHDVKETLAKKLCTELKDGPFIEYRSEDRSDGGREYTAELFIARRADDG